MGFGSNYLKLFICVCVCMCFYRRSTLQGKEKPSTKQFLNDALQLFSSFIVLDKFASASISNPNTPSGPSYIQPQDHGNHGMHLTPQKQLCLNTLNCISSVVEPTSHPASSAQAAGAGVPEFMIMRVVQEPSELHCMDTTGGVSLQAY